MTTAFEMKNTVHFPPFVTHLQLLQGCSCHVGVLEVDEGTEALVKNSDALNFTKPVTMETEPLTYSKATDNLVIIIQYSYSSTLSFPLLKVVITLQYNWYYYCYSYYKHYFNYFCNYTKATTTRV